MTAKVTVVAGDKCGGTKCPSHCRSLSLPAAFHQSPVLNCRGFGVEPQLFFSISLTHCQIVY